MKNLLIALFMVLLCSCGAQNTPPQPESNVVQVEVVLRNGKKITAKGVAKGQAKAWQIKSAIEIALKLMDHD